jgi:hypothetical protein
VELEVSWAGRRDCTQQAFQVMFDEQQQFRASFAGSSANCDDFCAVCADNCARMQSCQGLSFDVQTTL